MYSVRVHICPTCQWTCAAWVHQYATPSPTPPPAVPLAPRVENTVAESKSVMTVYGRILRLCPNREPQWHISEYAQVPGNAR